MASHESYGHSSPQGHRSIHAQSQQPGLEFDDSERRAFSDKQTIITNTSQPYNKRGIDGADSNDGNDLPQRRSRNPFGLSPLLFGCLVALVTAIVIGGAVGGGVGSQIKSCSSKSSPISTTTVFITGTGATTSAPSSPTVPYTDYIAPLPSQILSVPLDCPALDTQTLSTRIGDRYTFACGIDYTGNDLSALIAYHLEDCYTACSAYNFQQNSSHLNQSCQAFTFNANMTFAYTNENPPGGNNCFLKFKAGPGNNAGSSLRVVSGKLVI